MWCAGTLTVWPCVTCSGAELSDEKGSPLPGVRLEENEKTREKMQLVRSQMENMSLKKERKAKVCCLLVFYYMRHHICYSAYMPLSVCLSVCLSHACFMSKRLNASSKFFHCLIGPSSSFSSPRVVAQIWWLHPHWGRQIQGGSNFRPICGYISETVLDRGRVTMEDEYKSYVLYRIVPLSMTLSDPEPQFQGHSIV